MNPVRGIQERHTSRAGHDFIDGILGQGSVHGERAARERAIMQEAKD